MSNGDIKSRPPGFLRASFFFFSFLCNFICYLLKNRKKKNITKKEFSTRRFSWTQGLRKAWGQSDIYTSWTTTFTRTFTFIFCHRHRHSGEKETIAGYPVHYHYYTGHTHVGTREKGRKRRISVLHVKKRSKTAKTSGTIQGIKKPHTCRGREYLEGRYLRVR